MTIALCQQDFFSVMILITFRVDNLVVKTDSTHTGSLGLIRGDGRENELVVGPC